MDKPDSQTDTRRQSATITLGEGLELPIVEVLAGRSFITGKSGSGKSNTASVIIEELLDQQFPVMIVDTDGEYWGLKEDYEILHVGGDNECDLIVGPEHAEKLAELSLEQNVPIILDVSGYLEESEKDELIRETARHLFAKEKKLQRPFLLLVEECHEYIPENSGLSDVGKMLIRVAKRGRKHGLGICGISQRPANVKKDFITQCDLPRYVTGVVRLILQKGGSVTRREVADDVGIKSAGNIGKAMKALSDQGVVELSGAGDQQKADFAFESIQRQYESETIIENVGLNTNA